MYNICKGVTEGLCIQYQQIMQYIQNNNTEIQNPRQLFIYDFVKQCKVWKDARDSLIMIGNINDDSISGELTKQLKEQVELEEFTSPFWFGKPPASHINGNDFIVLAMKLKNIEVTQLLLLPWSTSVGDHRSWIVEFTTWLMLGPHLIKPKYQ